MGGGAWLSGHITVGECQPPDCLLTVVSFTSETGNMEVASL